MKNTTKLLALLMLLVVFQFTSCQKEEVVLIDETPQEGTLTDNSPLTLLLVRISLNDSNNDDFIDGADCFSITFPFAVTIGDTDFIIENEADYQEVIDFILASGGSTNDIEINFPITIVFPNYIEVIVNNQEELNTYAADCSNGVDLVIDCLNFVYPITFFVFDSATEETSTIVVENDEEMFLFLSNLSPTDYISIDYPISVETENGIVVTVSSNQELENLINSCANDGNTNIAELIEFLTTDSWYVSYFFEEVDYTSDFCEYEFTFNTNGTVIANNGTNTVNGSWAVQEDDDHLEVDIDFGTSIPFEELNDDWDLLNATINIIELFDESDDNDPTDYLTFNREPTICEGNNSQLIEFLTTDSWYVAYYFNDVDETSNYCEYEFTFNSNATVFASNGTNLVNGTWSVITDSSVEKVVLDFGNDIPFDELNDDWDVLNASITEIELQDTSGGNGGTDLLTFDREPTICEGNNSQLIEFLITDSWYIAYYFSDDDETPNYCEYELTFNPAGSVIASNGTDLVDGTWDVILDNNVEKLVLDFGVDIPFDELNDDWEVLNASMNEIEMQDISGGGGSTDYLTFDRVPTICDDGDTYLEQVLSDGQWLVALYLDDGINETNNYNGYILEFFNDGTVTASYGANVLNGTWNVTGNTGDLNLVLDFGVQIPFDKFNDDWDVLDVQVDSVELEDVSGGGTDTLTFEKI